MVTHVICMRWFTEAPNVLPPNRTYTDDVDAAVSVADGADIAFVCAGATTTESTDRDSLSLDQESFVSDVAAASSTPMVATLLSPVCHV